jgi:hypothetical protein
MIRILKYLGLLLLLIVFIYMIGPRVKFNTIDFSKITNIEFPISSIDSAIVESESEIALIKAGNEAQIIWADSLGHKTAYSIVYIHGFSASHKEGDPIHRNIAKRYGANLYLSRLYDVLLYV